MTAAVEFGPATPAEAVLAERRALETLEGFLALRWRTGWAEERTHCLVARSDSEVVSSIFALELPLLWSDGHGALQAQAVAALDSLVTPVRHRGRGYAGALLEWTQTWAEERDLAATALFSEIGPAYYQARGFRVVPLPFNRGPLPSPPETAAASSAGGRALPVPGGQVGRPFVIDDLEAVSRVYDAAVRDCPLAVARDLGYWRYHLEHSRFVGDLHSDEPHMRDFVVSGGEVTAYLRSRSDGDIFTVLEAACLPGAEPTLRDLVSEELGRASKEGCLRMVVHRQPTLPPLLPGLRLRESWYETFLARPAPGFAGRLDLLLAGGPGARAPYMFRPDYF